MAKHVVVVYKNGICVQLGGLGLVFKPSQCTLRPTLIRLLVKFTHNARTFFSLVRL
jgi:hypothetical protein